MWLINTHNGIKEKGIKPINIEDYPAIKAHLDNYWDELSKRADKGDTPYNLRNCAYMEDFSKQKIVWIELTDHPNFSLDERSYYLNNTVFFMIGNYLEYIISFLNSKICEWYFDKICATSGVGTRRWIKMYIDQIRIPIIDTIEMTKFESIVNDLHLQKGEKLNTEILDIEINNRFAKLFGLSKDEIFEIEMTTL